MADPARRMEAEEAARLAAWLAIGKSWERAIAMAEVAASAAAATETDDGGPTESDMRGEVVHGQ